MYSFVEECSDAVSAHKKSNNFWFEKWANNKGRTFVIRSAWSCKELAVWERTRGRFSRRKQSAQ